MRSRVNEHQLAIGPVPLEILNAPDVDDARSVGRDLHFTADEARMQHSLLRISL